MEASVDLRTTVGAVPIARDVVSVQGPEATDFLQGQLTQDLATLDVGASARSLLLQPTGKVDAWLRVTRSDSEQLLLDVEQGFGELVLARLQRFKLRTKVDLALDHLSGLAIRGPRAGDFVPEPRSTIAAAAGWPGVDGIDLLSRDAIALAGVPLADWSDLEALRIECGVPALGAELTEATIPAEAGQWLIDASVSFTKGCYTGQELVARIDSRGGNVPRPIRGLLVDGDPAPVGASVSVDGKEVGHVTSSARCEALGAIALAPITRTVEIGVRVAVQSEGAEQSATVAELPLR
jgi:folate-binding protein YgfZ